MFNEKREFKFNKYQNETSRVADFERSECSCDNRQVYE